MNIYYYYSIKIDVPRFWKQIAKIAIVPILLILLFSYVKTLVDFSNVKYYILLIAAYVIMYCGAMYLFALNDYEKQLLHLKRKSK